MKEESKYNLEERTEKFGEDTISFCKTIKYSPINTPLISQLVRSSTSIGANYAEANSASSKKDFKNKIYICKKEAQETLHWFKMIVKAIPDKENQTETLLKECKELVLIFGKILSTLNKKNDN